MNEGPTILIDASQPRTLTEAWDRTLTLTFGVIRFRLASKRVRRNLRRLVILAMIIFAIVAPVQFGGFMVYVIIATPFYIVWRITKRVRKMLDTRRKA